MLKKYLRGRKHISKQKRQHFHAFQEEESHLFSVSCFLCFLCFFYPFYTFCIFLCFLRFLMLFFVLFTLFVLFVLFAVFMLFVVFFYVFYAFCCFLRFLYVWNLFVKKVLNYPNNFIYYTTKFLVCFLMLFRCIKKHLSESCLFAFYTFCTCKNSS